MTDRTFTPSNTTVCAPVTTFEDFLNEVEDDEFFEVSLMSQDSVILPSEPGRVIIRDSDGRKMCTLCIGIIKHNYTLSMFDKPSVREKKCSYAQ